jgi:hypothetical protein
VFLRAALHLNIANLAAGGDDGFPPQAATSGRVHSLDSNYTTDVLRSVAGLTLLIPAKKDPWTKELKRHKTLNVVFFRVVDPYSFFPDPDPEFDNWRPIRIRIQYGSGSNTDPGL